MAWSGVLNSQEFRQSICRPPVALPTSLSVTALGELFRQDRRAYVNVLHVAQFG